MALNLSIRQKLVLTQALLTFGVISVSGLAVYHLTARSLESESVSAAESEAYRAAHAIFAQLDKSLLVKSKGEARPFASVQAPISNWAIARGSGEVLAAGGEFASSGSSLGRAFESDVVELDDERVFRVVAVPFPKTPSESFDRLPPPVAEAIRRERPGALYLRGRREIEKDRPVFEVTLLDGREVFDLEIAADGEVLDKEKEDLPESLTSEWMASVLGIHDGKDYPVERWRCHDSQLLAVVDTGHRGRPKIITNRYGECFEVDEDGRVSGPTEETTIRLLVAADISGVRRAIGSLGFWLWIGGPIVWFLIVGIGWFVTCRAFTPVRRILDAAKRIEPSHLDARLPVGPVRDELFSISETINCMLDRLEAGFRRERRFTGDASHELRGPLARIIAEIDVALSKPRAPTEYLLALARCRSYADTLKSIVESLLLLSRLDQGHSLPDGEAVDVQSVLVDTLCGLRAEDRRRVVLELARDREPVALRGHAELLRVLMRNLLENALRYSPPEESVAARVRSRAAEVVLEFEDRGPGIPQGLRDRVFDRFYRLDESRTRESGGVGLGLSIVRSIVRVHGGSVEFAGADGRGTVARVILPSRIAGTHGLESPR